MPVIPAFWRLRQEDQELKASLSYTASSRPRYRYYEGMGINSLLRYLSSSLSQPAKILVPSYYCLYSLYNKIRNKGKIASAGY
jgi:hypothetical protein